MGEMKNIDIEIQNSKALKYILHEINMIKNRLDHIEKKEKKEK